MIERITIAIVDQSGEIVPIRHTNGKIEMKLEIATAELFTEIAQRLNAITDEEIRISEKFHLAKNLKNYLEETKNADSNGN